MKIGLDLQILERPLPTGVERAWRCLVRAVVADPGEDRFVLYSRGPVDLGLAPHRSVQAVALGGYEPVSLWRELRLAPALKQDGVELLHSPVAAIPLRTRVARVATIHELPWIRHPGVEGTGRELAHRLRVRMAVRFASLLVVPSVATERDLVGAHPEAAGRVRVVPHGVDAAFIEGAAPSDSVAVAAQRRAIDERLAALRLAGRRFFLGVGAARPRKDLPTLLEAFRLYRAAGGTADLMLAGPGEEPVELPEGVFRMGFLSDADLAQAYRAATALVYHSLNEGFGLPVIEAMSLGTPVIAADAGSVGEVAGEAALLTPSGDAAALAAAMGRVESEAGLAERLRAAGRVRATVFRWESAAAGVKEAWRRAMAAPPVPATGVADPEEEARIGKRPPRPRGEQEGPGAPRGGHRREGLFRSPDDGQGETREPRREEPVRRTDGPPSRDRGPRGTGSVRRDGPRRDGPPRGAGPRRDGPRRDGPRRDGPRRDGPPGRPGGDRPDSRGPRRDGPSRRPDGARPMDRGPRREGPPGRPGGDRPDSRGPRREGPPRRPDGARPADRGPRRDGPSGRPGGDRPDSRGPRRDGPPRGPGGPRPGPRGPRRDGPPRRPDEERPDGREGGGGPPSSKGP